MKLYGALLSPFVRKVAVMLGEKGLTYTPARSGPASTNPEFHRASPFAKVPAIDDDGFTLADSSAIVHYLEAQYPEPALIPAEARARGQAIWFDEFGDTILSASGRKIMFNRLVGPKLLGQPGNEAIALEGEAELPPLLDYLESVAPELGGPAEGGPAEGWLVGGMFSIADIAVASTLCTMTYVGHGPDAAKRPRTAAWHARVLARPSWQAVAEREAAQMSKLLPGYAAA